MSKTATSIAIETAETVKLETKLRIELKGLFAQYADTVLEAKAAEAEKDRLKGEIEECFDRHRASNALQAGVRLDGFGVKKHVGETKKTLDKKKLIAQGVTMAMIEAAITESPKKSYIKVHVPGDKQEERED